MSNSTPGTWVIVPEVEQALRPRSRQEFATYDVSTRLWKGWTTPGYRERRGTMRDWFSSLHEAMSVLVQVRRKYPSACPIRIDKPRDDVLARRSR